MKRIAGVLLLICNLISPSFGQAAAKDIVTEKINVSGVCGECKKRIEEAAYVPGVKRAEWNVATKILTVTYRPSKTTLKNIEEHIAAVGHDAGEVKAKDQDYQKLPGCCAYKEGVKTH
ncbi:MAG: heavy-metal-associated domain-containing protein [Edaphocola sp.]